MPTEYEAMWLETLAELRGCPALHPIRIDAETDFQQDTDRIYLGLAERDGIVLSPELTRRHLRFAELAAQWTLRDPRDSGRSLIAGEFCLTTLDRAIRSDEPDPVFDDETLPHYPELRCFDDTPWTGVGFLTMVRILQPGVSDPELWFDASTTGHHRLDIGYPEYLDTLRVTKGTFGWQLLFADVSLADDGEYAGIGRRMEDMLEVLPTLFPDHDYQPLRERLADRRRDYRLRCRV